ncbi:MAG: adenylosuccinate synthase [Marinilabiliales bacterium]|nr:MAG: adenylosuccinate synthase [Marinilabiliales bacterium]
MHKIDVLLGLQWGDEGKGKIVDVLAPEYDVIARFQGGPNAGHSLEFSGIKHILHTIPSGIFHAGKINLIGNGVVIDPTVFKKEIDALGSLGVNAVNNLFISRKAHLILPSHRLLDAASEALKGNSKIGSTLKGIGPAYMDKTGRNGLRIGDIMLPGFNDRYSFLKEKHRAILKQYDFDDKPENYEEEWFRGIEKIKEFQVVDSEYFINNLLAENKKILAEGAQGTLLDIDFGSYPYVTSSNTVCAGACTGLGIAPSKTGEVIGVFKAYCTRVGGGPFPTELTDETGDRIRDQGKEFGSTTGRPRRCGWLDLPALKYSVLINGVTQLMITKADVLTGLDSINICTAYKHEGRVTETMPYDMAGNLEPVYREFSGWNEDLSSIKSCDDLPAEFKKYISYIEEETGVPVTMISLGPDRTAAVFPGKE